VHTLWSDRLCVYTLCYVVPEQPIELLFSKNWTWVKTWVRATSHTNLRACDDYTSSTLIGGKGGAGPSSLHTMLEGPTEYVTARWMSSLHRFLHGIEWIMFHGHMGDHGTPNAHNHFFILLYHVWGPAWIKIHCNSIWLKAWSHITSHYTWGSVTTLHDFTECLGMAFGHFLVGSHNFMVTALGSCVKWP
jgi:hypothetical protein